MKAIFKKIQSRLVSLATPVAHGNIRETRLEEVPGENFPHFHLAPSANGVYQFHDDWSVSLPVPCKVHYYAATDSLVLSCEQFALSLNPIIPGGKGRTAVQLLQLTEADIPKDAAAKAVNDNFQGATGTWYEAVKYDNSEGTSYLVTEGVLLADSNHGLSFHISPASESDWPLVREVRSSLAYTNLQN